METTRSSPRIMVLTAPISQNFPHWLRSVRTLASTVCTQHFPDGLNSKYNLFIIDEVEAMLPHNLPPSFRPEMPLNVIGPLGKRRYKLWEINDSKIVDIMLGLIFIKSELILSLPPEIKAMLEDPVNGFSNVSIHDIISYVTKNYGRLTASDISYIRARIEAECNSASAFTLVCANMMQDCTSLRSNGIVSHCESTESCNIFSRPLFYSFSFFIIITGVL